MKKKLISCLLVASMVIGMTACGNKQASTETNKSEQSESTVKESEATGTESTNTEEAEEREYEIIVRTSAKAPYSPEETLLYQELEEETGVHINWKVYDSAAWNEQRNLILAGDDLPDAFFGHAIFWPEHVVKFSADGAIIPLEDYITEENTPNLWRMFEEHPDWKAAITAPDGHIYGLPSVDDSEQTAKTNNVMFINKDWLDAVGKEVPTTTEEFREVLRAFKEEDPNGNGIADEIPYSFYSGTNFCSDFFGAFGIPDNTTDHIGVKDGKVVYTAAEDYYKEAIKYFNSLYEEGLIDQEAFTQDSSVFNAKVMSETRVVGVLEGWRKTTWQLSADDDSYVAFGPLEGPEGAKYALRTVTGVTAPGSFAITKSCEDPMGVMNWVDNCYDPVFAMQAGYALKIGVHLEEQADGTYKQILEGTDENRAHVTPGTVNRIYVSTDETISLLDGVAAHIAEKMELDKVYENYYYPEQFPTMLMSAEDTTTVSTLQVEINSYANQQYATWITNGGIEEEWEDYLKQLDAMGLQELIAVYQKNLDFYNANK